MKIISNNPGYMIVTVNSDTDTASHTFNEVAGYAAGDGIAYLKVGSVKLPLSDEPASHVLTFGSAVTLTYSDDDGKAVTVGEA